MSLIAQAPVPATFQLTFDRMPHWCKALAQARAGTASANIFLVGDSTTAGYGALAGNAIGARPVSYPATLLKVLAGHGVACSADGFVSDNNVSINSITLAQYDPRVTLGSGWSTTTGSSFCGGAVANTSTSNPQTFTPGNPFDTVTVIYAQIGSGGGSSVVSVGGTTIGTVSHAGSGLVLTASTYTCTRTTGTVTITPSGSCFIFSVQCSDSTKPGLRLYQLGFCGGTAASFTTALNSFANFQTFAPLVPPALTVIQLTINDANQGTALSTYTTNLQAVITTAKTTGDVVLMVGVPSAATQCATATQLLYAQAVYALAQSNNVPLIDMRARWQTYETINPYGYMDDVIHPTAAGYGDMGGFIARALLSV